MGYWTDRLAEASLPPWREFRDYQDEGIDFIVDNPFSGLFIDMGLGKTGLVLHALLELPGPTLLVGPIRVIETVWRKEADQWPATKLRGFRFSLIRGKPKERAKALAQDADIYLVNPELLEEVLASGKVFHNLVVDESTLFKNPSSARFKLLRKHLHKFTRRIIMTGTPTPNSLLELWSQIFLLDRGERLDTAFGRFKQKYFYQADYHGYSFLPHDWAREKIVEEISDIVYRVSAEGALPPREVIRNIVHTPLPDEAWKTYKQMERLAFSQLDEETVVTAATAAVVSMKLRQLASGFVYDENGEPYQVHSEKIKAVKSILEETGSPVILIYQFIHELEALRKAFPQGVVFESEHEEAWNRGEIPLLFLHPQSGGHGLNLQYGGHTMIVFSASFSLEQMAQVMARIDRQGQIFPVVFHFLVATGTIDELLIEVLDTRARDQSEVLRMLKAYALERKNG